MRIGIGYDVHSLVSDRPLVLGGTTIPHDMGLEGHSDADVLLHAVCDAILGAAGMGDIGIHFPDSDPAYKNISSITLLSKTWDMVKCRFGTLVNIDATILAEAPRIAPFADSMKKTIAKTLNASPDQVNVKATTNEGLGFIGKKEGIAAMAVVLIE
jgi:2-C-methyl-D-erythritol 2,4-cyclodiphosphate synthase